MDSQTVTAWSAAIQAFAAVATLVVTAILVHVTHRYVKLTKSILEETGKARLAAEQSARAAQDSAHAAFETIHLMREERAEAAGLGRTIAQTGITGAKEVIEFWRARDITRLAALKALPPTDNLIPSNVRAVVDHAARISGEAAKRISSAFTDMQAARDTIESIREIEIGMARSLGVYKEEVESASKFLDSAFGKLVDADLILSLPANGRLTI